MIPVTRSSMPLFEEYCEEISSIWKTVQLSNSGEKHQQLELSLVKYLEVPFLSLFVNGHSALECAISMLDNPGDEVITSPFTFLSTTNAIVRNGLKPVFCDISPDSYTIDPSQIEACISERTKAIVPIHVYGNICDVSSIQDISDDYDIPVIYDAAHAFGESYCGTAIGNFGYYSMFSFHATKVFHTIEGGAVVCHDEMSKEKFERAKNYGMISKEDADFPGGNMKMNEFQAAMGICNLRHIADNIRNRKRVVDIYRDELSNVPGIKVNEKQDGLVSNYAYFPIVVDKNQYGLSRNQLVDYLSQKGIMARKYFYPLTSELKYLREGYCNSTPIAKMISDSVLTLPLYSSMSDSDVLTVCQSIKEVQK